ncbi:hypothetical protein K523DRAFT_94425 [Schizophyllum commune Tattone D]|nr:hypothetical protein K523DRAFT_94425 [Schizophyllum commune Tattone D]
MGVHTRWMTRYHQQPRARRRTTTFVRMRVCIYQHALELHLSTPIILLVYSISLPRCAFIPFRARPRLNVFHALGFVHLALGPIPHWRYLGPSRTLHALCPSLPRSVHALPERLEARLLAPCLDARPPRGLDALRARPCAVPMGLQGYLDFQVRRGRCAQHPSASGVWRRYP